MNTNEVLMVFGRKRSGKTTEALRRLADSDRVIYIDPKGGEYQFGVECSNLRDVRALTETWRKDKPPKFCVRVPTREEYWTTYLCRQALKVSKDAKVTVGIDEIQYFSRSRYSADGIHDILAEGGWRGVSLVGIAHRPTDVQIDLLAAADRILVFQTTHSDDIERLQHYIDLDDDIFMSLRLGEYIEWSVDGGHVIHRKKGGEDNADVETEETEDSEPEAGIPEHNE